jgi:hypothetical protein
MMHAIITPTRNLLSNECSCITDSVPDVLQPYLSLMRTLNDGGFAQPAALLDALRAVPTTLLERCMPLVVNMVALAQDGDPAFMRVVDAHVATTSPSFCLAAIRRQAMSLSLEWRTLVEGARFKALARMASAPSVEDVVAWLLDGDERALEADVCAGFEAEMARALVQLFEMHTGAVVPVHTLPCGNAHIKPIDILWVLCKYT